MNLLKYYSFYVYGKLRTYLHYYYYNDINNENNINHIVDNLYVGDIYSASNKEILDQNKINCVVSCVCGLDELFPENIKYLNLDLIDNEEESISRCFNTTNQFIEKNSNNNNNILIHCIAGVSRSVTILIAYLIYKHDYTPTEALKIVREKRINANPNAYFMKQLNDYYTELQLSRQL